jgi:glycosyltransferase involved in cell wall biosynthesis
VLRGAEIQAYELKRQFKCRTEIFSLFDSPFTWKIPGIKRTDRIFPLLRAYEKTARVTKFYRIFRKGPIEAYTADHFEELTFGFNMARELDRFQPDVTVNIGGPNVGIFVEKYREKRGVPFLTVGGSGKGRIETWNAQTRPDYYVAQTPSIERFIHEVAPGVKTVLIPNGADLKRFDPSGVRFNEEELRRLSLITDPLVERPLILSTSALSDNKRLDALIESCALLKHGTLVLVGDGDQKKKLLALAKSRLGRKFVYLGIIPYSEIDKIYRSCDVFCLPSINEPFGTVFIEAMAANLPVVAGRDEDREWMLGSQGGVLTDVLDTKSLARALQEAAARDWKNGPRRNAETRFSWEVIARDFERIFESLKTSSGLI